MATKSHDLLLNELMLSRDAFLESLRGVTEAQWQFKPEAQRWSIGETGEHVALVEAGIRRLLAGKLFETPVPSAQRAEFKTRDARVTAAMFDRSVVRQAPDPVLPRGRWATRTEVETVFRTLRDESIRWLQDTQADLRAYCAPHPVLGMLDGKQWLLFMAAHTARHTRQIQDLKQAPGFPG